MMVRYLKIASGTLLLGLSLISIGYLSLPNPQVIRPGLEVRVNQVIKAGPNTSEVLSNLIILRDSSKPLNRTESIYFELVIGVISRDAKANV